MPNVIAKLLQPCPRLRLVAPRSRSTSTSCRWITQLSVNKVPVEQSPVSCPQPPALDPRNRELAISYYDKFYGRIYGDEEYQSRIRPALLTPPQYVALPNPFTADGEGLGNYLRGLGAFSMKDGLTVSSQKIQNQDDIAVHQITRKLEEDVVTFLKKFVSEELPFPPWYYESLQKMPEVKVPYLEETDDSNGTTSRTGLWPGGGLDPHMFEVGSSRKFPPSRIHESGVSSYLYINGGSLAPVLALDLTPSCHLLDICAGPGTKSLMALISSNVASLVCNDLKPNRVGRTVTLLQHYMGPSSGSVTHTCHDGREFSLGSKFDKILVDSPCSNDRESCRVLGNNLFRRERKEERWELWETQKELLKRGVKLLKSDPSSALVYSTCSLSPCENDGVVLAALGELEDLEVNVAVDLRGLVKLLGRFSHIYKMIVTLTGVLIVPSVGRNFGPMFISRIKPDMKNGGKMS